MALPYDIRELMYQGKPIWKRVMECLFSLSDQIDELDGGGGTSASSLTSKIDALEKRVEDLENGADPQQDEG